MSLEKQIKDGWKAYKYNSNKCHEIARRVKNRKVDGIAYGYALPGETDEYDKRARNLRDIEEYIHHKQMEYNHRYERKAYSRDMKMKEFKRQFEEQNLKIEQQRHEFAINN
jgi:hypothetical protein